MTRWTVGVIVGSNSMVSLMRNVHEGGTLFIANEPQMCPSSNVKKCG